MDVLYGQLERAITPSLPLNQEHPRIQVDEATKWKLKYFQEKQRQEEAIRNLTVGYRRLVDDVQKEIDKQKHELHQVWMLPKEEQSSVGKSREEVLESLKQRLNQLVLFKGVDQETLNQVFVANAELDLAEYNQLKNEYDVYRRNIGDLKKIYDKLCTELANKTSELERIETGLTDTSSVSSCPVCLDLCPRMKGVKCENGHFWCYWCIVGSCVAAGVKPFIVLNHQVIPPTTTTYGRGKKRKVGLISDIKGIASHNSIPTKDEDFCIDNLQELDLTCPTCRSTKFTF